MAVNKRAGSNLGRAADLKAGLIQGLINGGMTYCGRIVFGAAGAVSSVTGAYVSAVSLAAGVYRVYFPQCTDICIIPGYGTTATWGNNVKVSTVSTAYTGAGATGGGYADLVVHSAAGVSTPASGDYITLIAHMATSKVRA